MDRIFIRKLINNIYSESQYINTIMELADRKNPDSAIALSQEETQEIVILLSQADYLHDYLKEYGVSSEKDEINERSVKEIVQLLANNLISEETGYNLITNLLNANTDTKPNTVTEEKTAKVVNYVCDHCGFWLTDGIMDYCPGCGAKLEWKNEEH